MSEKQSRSFLGILYPDSDTYSLFTKKLLIQTIFDEWAFILHDKDTDSQGNLKKPHVHWLARGDQPKTLSNIAHKLELPENDIEYCGKFAAQARYLLHLDDPDKVQYNRESVECSPGLDLAQFWDKLDDTKQSKMLFAWLCQSGCTSPGELAAWSFENGCWSAYRRGFSVWASIMREMHERVWSK